MLWICEEERSRGDWFSLFVNETDYTVHVRFSPLSDGVIHLSALTPQFDFIESVEVNKNAQCLNIKSGSSPTPLYLNLTALRIFADGDDRVDYQLSVIPTDLNLNPRGECDVLNQGLYLNHAWPTLVLD